MKKITLPWMDKMRNWKKEGYSDSKVLDSIMRYGEGEEQRITKAFEKTNQEIVLLEKKLDTKAREGNESIII